MAKVTVNREVCRGLGECEALAPLVFEVQDYGAVEVLVDDVPAEELENVRRAVDRCPTSALTLSG